MAIVSTSVAGWCFVARLRKSSWIGLSDWLVSGGLVSYVECFDHEVELTKLVDPKLRLLQPFCNSGCEWCSIMKTTHVVVQVEDAMSQQTSSVKQLLKTGKAIRFCPKR
jgi:hypothetical protein